MKHMIKFLRHPEKLVIEYLSEGIGVPQSGIYVHTGRDELGYPTILIYLGSDLKSAYEFLTIHGNSYELAALYGNQDLPGLKTTGYGG